MGIGRCGRGGHRQVRVLALALLLGLLLPLTGVPGRTSLAAASRPLAPTPPAPTKILLVGDSITQGAAGDWTWRYRLGKHLQSTNANVDFVGQYKTVYDINKPSTDLSAYLSTDYALGVEPGFDRDHQASWGDSYGDFNSSIGAVMAQQNPDVVISAMGTNDLRPFNGPGVDAATAEARTRSFITDLRQANPTAAVVLTKIPVRVPSSGIDPALYNQRFNDYNASLDAIAADSSLNTASAPVVVADPGLFTAADTWDDTHPTPQGEEKIAAAVAVALQGLGIGGAYQSTVPTTWSPKATIDSAQTISTPLRIKVAWHSAPGVKAEIVSWRDVTAGGANAAWQQIATPASGEVRIKDPVVQGHQYQVRLQSKRGTLLSNAYSAVTTLWAMDLPGRPGQPWLTPTLHGFDVSWPPATSAYDGYTVSYRGPDKSSAVRTVTTSQTSVALSDLIAGGSYEVWVEAHNPKGDGVISVVSTGVPAGPPLFAPSGVAVAYAPNFSAQATWTGVPNATSYQAQIRAMGASDWWTVTVDGSTTTAATLPGVLPGSTYEVRVRAVHQRLPSEWSPIIELKPAQQPEPTPTVTPSESTPVVPPPPVTPIPVPPVVVPPAPQQPLTAVTNVRARSRKNGKVAVTGTVVAGATSYVLSTVRARTCRRMPAAGKFKRSKKTYARPSAVLRLRRNALWVRWEAARGQELGPTQSTSFACIAVRVER